MTRPVSFLLVLAWCAPALAAQSPEELVRETTNTLLRSVESQKSELKRNPEGVQAIVKEILLPVVDVQGVARWVLGKYWRRATAEQRQRFTEEFKELLIRTYSYPLVEYTDVRVTYRNTRVGPEGDEATVRTVIDPGDREPIAVDYGLHRKYGDWRVYDVTVEGISALVSFRNTYSEHVQRWGLDGLIERMARKNRGEDGEASDSLLPETVRRAN